MSASSVGSVSFDDMEQLVVQIENEDPDHTIIIYRDEPVPADNVWGDPR